MKRIYSAILFAFISLMLIGQSDFGVRDLKVKGNIVFKTGQQITPEKVDQIDAFIVDSGNVASVTKDASPDTVLTKSGSSIKYIVIGTTGSVYASGTAATVPTTTAMLNFGTTDPSIALTTAGTYIIWSTASINLTGYTNDTVQTVTCKLRRTNNTAADLTNASATITVPVSTTVTTSAGTVIVPAIVYTTANTDDTIQLFGVVTDAPDAGTITATQAHIMAYRIK